MLERDTEAYVVYMLRDYKDYVGEMQRMMKPLLEARSSGPIRTSLSSRLPPRRN